MLTIAEGTLGCNGILATRGPSLFSNWTNKLDVLGLIRGYIWIKLDRIGPWLSLELLYGQFGFSATRGPSKLSKPNLKMALYGIKRCPSGMKLAKIGLWP